MLLVNIFRIFIHIAGIIKRYQIPDVAFGNNGDKLQFDTYLFSIYVNTNVALWRVHINLWPACWLYLASPGLRHGRHGVRILAYRLGVPGFFHGDKAVGT